MDIRGIEVTNQLRSAIRAKLLELGVRYDEELPDYILVMVVNKKSRQQMHEDLYLFLESCTTPFVDWLHDQVLKKLQKVTVAKKKSLREFVPTVVVKQEEERKKKKACTTSFLDDQTVNQTTNKNLKDDKSFHKQNAKPSISSQKLDATQNKNIDKSVKNISHESKSDGTPNHIVSQQPVIKRTQVTDNQSVGVNKEVFTVETLNTKSGDSHVNAKVDDKSSRNLKRPLEMTNNYKDNLEKKQTEAKRSKIEENGEDTTEDNAKKLKSCVNKPKVTSVVSVKNRLGVVSPRKKFEVHRERMDSESRYRQNEKHLEKHRLDSNRSSNFQRGRNFDADERSKRNRETDLKHNESDKVINIKTRLGNAKIDKTPKSIDLKEKVNSIVKSRSVEKTGGTIKDRLGIANKLPKQLGNKEPIDFKSKPLEQDRDPSAINKNIKNRLGPLKNNFKPLNIKSAFNSSIRKSQSSEDDDYLNLGAEEELDDDAQSVGNSGPIKSHIIAVNKPPPIKTERKRLKSLERGNKQSSDMDEDMEETKIPSKVIVTPRPLKPLQPAQKRATQSLLLRAVAEANQSVVTQKNPEPSLLDKKQTLKRLKPAPVRDVGQNLSVHLNSNKRLVMEKIQVELNTDITEMKAKPYVPQPVTEEHMGVVMSLFQRSDDNQKFLVTLNGYNNNHVNEKNMSDDEERLEMEGSPLFSTQVNEDDELALSTIQNDMYVQNESETSVFQITEAEEEGDLKERTDENNENCNTENVEKIEEAPRRRRKLSPIVYNRSHSPSPVDLKSNTLVTSSVLTKRLEKKPSTENSVTVIDKSKEKCRYWPNCTLGNKCSYLHPAVMCSAFPACKFGDKCAYKHPKCKFGLSCTKLGCVFSHPAQQCKYHPFCTKPACPYSHPMPATVEPSSQRAKFTWRRRD
ncbi:zinc finger CCCH domain-containing protein 14 isoform X1 [Osmia bicornis bicornis]|uniref:zinc finger CCCH domain-containing protein 14 isoform X1 n=1 Tax=Osmia bicornis bicornis TaxID=1437191 RepID=UPI001EAF2884|nr:zinc finger CCCH domain-containing protein 14 isoform X1 [Osmia bicornis bicornis]